MTVTPFRLTAPPGQYARFICWHCIPSAKGYEQASLLMHIAIAMEIAHPVARCKLQLPTYNPQCSANRDPQDGYNTFDITGLADVTGVSANFHIAILWLSARYISILNYWFHNQAHQIVLPFYPSMLRYAACPFVCNRFWIVGLNLEIWTTYLQCSSYLRFRLLASHLAYS